jgi:hypothetical protein
VAGKFTAGPLGDGGPATNAQLSATEGIWMDGSCNLYISAGQRIRKVNIETGIITTLAGTGIGGFSGDGGPATAAQIKVAYGLWSDSMGNVYFADPNNRRIRRVDGLTNIITTFAGGGTSLVDGGPATNAQFTDPAYVYGDKQGNIYIGDKCRLWKVNISTNIITTISGNGIYGLSGDGGPATAAQISPAGMLCDAQSNLLIADRGNSRIRKIDNSGIITTIAGTTPGFSGDGGPATNAELYGPISMVLDNKGNLIIGDNGNDHMRKVDAMTGIITTIAGVGTWVLGSKDEDAPATAAEIHPEFLYLDLAGNLYFSNFGGQVRKISYFNPGLSASGSQCNYGNLSVPSLEHGEIVNISPNPAANELNINITAGSYTSFIITNCLGQVVMQQPLNSAATKVNIQPLASGMYYITLLGDASVVTRRFVKMD